MPTEHRIPIETKQNEVFVPQLPAIELQAELIEKDDGIGALNSTEASIPDHLKCAICSFVVKDPVVVPWDPEHKPVCGPCFKFGIMENGGVCPLTGTGECDAYLECLLPDTQLDAKAKLFNDSIIVKHKKHRGRECGDIESPLLSRGWEMGSFEDRNQNRTCWISPVRKIRFVLHKDALKFDSLVQNHGDEYAAWESYSDLREEQGVQRRVIDSKLYDTNINLESCGWIKGKKRGRRIWLSPQYKIPFLWQKVAIEFHQHRQNYDDEAKAMEDFLDKRAVSISKKVSDFILGGSCTVERHIHGEVDVDNLDSLASQFGIKFLFAPSSQAGQKTIPIVRKKRETLVFDLEVANPPPATTRCISNRRATQKLKKVTGTIHTRSTKRKEAQKCKTVAGTIRTRSTRRKEVKVAVVTPKKKESRKLRQERVLFEMSASVIGHMKLNGE
jgi:hypothetical protein